MKFTQVTKRMKKLFVIATEGNIKMAIEWNIIDNIVNVNWCTLNEKLYNNADESIKDRFIEEAVTYIKGTDKYSEILKKYNK